MSEVLCPSCGSLAPAKARECPECGTSLFSTEERTDVKARIQEEMGRTLDNDAIEEPELTPSPLRMPPQPRRVLAPSVSDSTIPFKGGGASAITGEDLAQTVIPPPVSAPHASPMKRSGLRALALSSAAPTERTPVVVLPPVTLVAKAEALATEYALGALNVQSKKDALIGTKLGEYTVEERVGIGGMGIVYRAVQPMIGNSVAIKVLRPDVIVDADDMNRFLGEAKTVNQIRHRSIISIFGAGDTEDGRKYLVMEFLEGESLEARQLREGRLPTAEALPILEDVLSALAAAHAANVVHRDLKPANVFLVHQSDGRPWVKLLDFGLARRSSQDVSRIAGTPDYISPEHARGKPAGPPADLYAFGVMAFHLLTGRLPFIGTTPMEVMEQHVHKAPPNPAEVDSTIPPAMSELIVRLLDKEPQNRPDAKTVKADLKAAAKQLRSAQTQIGPMPTSTGTVIREQGTRPDTGDDLPPRPEARPDPRLERLAIAADRTKESNRGGAFSRNWPWFAGGLALLWLLAVAVYVLMTPAPVPHTDAVPIAPPKEEPIVAPEPENDVSPTTPLGPDNAEKAPKKPDK